MLNLNAPSTGDWICVKSLLSVWRVDRRQALRMCEDRQVEVNASDAFDVSLAKVDDPWPSCLAVRFRNRLCLLLVVNFFGGRQGVLLFALFPVDFNGTARIRAALFCWVDAWSHELHVKKSRNKNTMPLSSAEAKLHEVDNGTARGLFIRHVLQAIELKATVRVETDSTAAPGITQRLGAVWVRHLEVKDLGIQEKFWSHELRISREKSEDTGADLLTMFLDSERQHKLVKLLPLRVPGTKRRVANSVALTVVLCSLLPASCAACHQLEKVKKIEEMSVAAGWAARESTTQVFQSWSSCTLGFLLCCFFCFFACHFKNVTTSQRLKLDCCLWDALPA